MGSTSEQGVPPGYVEEEYVATGRATAYENVGPLAEDGTWTYRETDKERYRTRVLVRRPSGGGTGIVLLEWLNVSGGLDADPAYQTVSEEIVRAGHTWVGVSAQKIGVEGGEVAVAPDIPGAGDVVGKGLKAIDPERYGSLQHPGDRFSLDIVTQVARALAAGGPATGDAVPTQVLAMGESQAAFGLVAYVNGVQPLTSAFDGFFVESRSRSALVMPKGNEAADITDTIVGPPTTFRTDTEVPIFNLQSETDLVGIMSSFAVRQPDTDLFRLWEAAGTAHADLHLVGEATARSLDCGASDQRRSAARHRQGRVAAPGDVGGRRPPPTASLIELSPEGVARNADGLASAAHPAATRRPACCQVTPAAPTTCSACSSAPRARSPSAGSPSCTPTVRTSRSATKPVSRTRSPPATCSRRTVQH